MQTRILFKKVGVKLEREAGLWLSASALFPCGVNNSEKKSILIKGEVGEEIPAWV